LTQHAPWQGESAPAEGEQLDFTRTNDELREYQRSLRASVTRLTIKEVAYELNLAPESLEHQLKRWDRRKRPSAECAFVCLKRDPEHRAEVMGQLGCVVSPKPKLTPREAIRAITERAGAKGYVSMPEITALLSQTDWGGMKP
jgi:hypothetical protein